MTVPRPDWGEAKAEEWLRHLNYAVLENTSVHEAYPGHYLQSLHERRSSSLTRKLFWSYANVEGFAHYCEAMMLEAGYSANAGVRLAQSLDALLRDARFLVALGLHTQAMPMAAAIETFRSVAFLSELPATREHPQLAGRRSTPLTRAELAAFDVAIICADHDVVDYRLLVDHCPLIIDTRNICARRGLASDRIIKA